MIYALPAATDPFAAYIKDDPVRPHIPTEQRFGTNSQVLALTDGDKVRAMVCAKFCKGIPSTEQELLADTNAEPDTVVFYTIWSYSAGAGQELIKQGLELVQKTRPTVTRYVTLSPRTELARRFHLRNGANIFRVNDDTVNYEYTSTQV